MTVISKLTTAAGTKVTKLLEEPMRSGYGKMCKIIEYSPNSKLAQLGIDKVCIRDAGKEGKHIMAFRGNKCLFLGETNPAAKIVQSVTDQFKEYLDHAKSWAQYNR